MRTIKTAMIGLPLIAAALPAEAATRNIPVPSFNKLRVEGPYTVRVHTGGSVSVKASGPETLLDKLVVETRGNTLLVSTEKGWSWRGMSWGKQETVYVDISVPMIEAAELNGSGTVTVDKVRATGFTALLTGSGDLDISRLETGNLKATVTGSGDLALAGKAGRADMSVTGSGNLRAGGLTVNVLTASVLGSGDLDVGATRTAKARVMGSGDISIAGRPTCTTSKMGSGDIKCGG